MIRSLLFTTVTAVLLTQGCLRNSFFPDENNPGLSRLTSRGYGQTTFYLNGIAYTSPYQPNVITKIPGSGNAEDSICFTWNSYKNVFDYKGNINLSIIIPVPKNFEKKDLTRFNGERFTDNSKVLRLISGDSTLIDSSRGNANIYFIAVASKYNDSGIEFSGIFNGNAGTDKEISKGRFDFFVDYNYIIF